MRQEFSKGLDFANNDLAGLDDMLKSNNSSAGCWAKFLASMTYFWQEWGPLNSTVTSIQKRYDQSVASYFVFFRFLFLISMIFAAIYTYLLVAHIVRTEDFSKTCMFNFVPCFLLYNSFQKTESLAYTITLISTLGIGFATCLYQLVTQDRIKRIQAYVLQDGSKKFSKMFFSSLDWSLTKPGQKLDSKISLTINLENMLKEEKILEIIKNRT